MSQKQLMSKLNLDDREIAARRAHFQITDEVLATLVAMRPFAERHTGEIVERFYDHLLSLPETRRFFPDEATIRRMKSTQSGYFLELFAGRCDAAYVENRLRVGAVHERIGLPPKWYVAAYQKYSELLFERMLLAEFPHGDARESYRCVQRLIHFDVALAFDAYVLASALTVSRHQAAIRELSTPVIRVHDRVLLLPLVGAIDSQRAQQVMETVLTRVVEDQARAVILDIAGVAVVDTTVADHLVKTTAAIRLLGTETILTGISAQIARTIVQLGVDISTMHTRARLADGIELALSLVGKAITAVR